MRTGEIGEIVVTGQHVLKGYLDGRGDDETKFRVEEEIWHRTGDSGYLDEQGRLWLWNLSELGSCASPRFWVCASSNPRFEAPQRAASVDFSLKYQQWGTIPQPLDPQSSALPIELCRQQENRTGPVGGRQGSAGRTALGTLQGPLLGLFHLLGPDALKKPLCRSDAFGLGQTLAFVLDSDPAVIPRIEHDLHHAGIVDLGLVALFVKVV